jgi:hypothetical protein
MSTSRKHTHVGHCQACARTHAVGIKSGKVAKHGYTTRFGFFMGTCSGSDKKPLEVSREFADATLVALEEYAVREVARAAALRAGTVTLEKVATGKKARDAHGNYMRDRNGERVPELVAWDLATEEQRAEAVRRALSECANNVVGARAHARQLAALIPKIFGQPLTSVAPVDAVADAPLAVGDTVRVFGKTGFDAVVIAIRYKVAEGCGPYLNGNSMPHAFFAREKGGEFALPVRNIRRASIVKRAAAEA